MSPPLPLPPALRCLLFSTTLAQEYAVFNNWHAGIPGSTMINRAYIDSATSDGMGNNDVEDILLGYPQRTIYEVMTDALFLCRCVFAWANLFIG